MAKKKRRMTLDDFREYFLNEGSYSRNVECSSFEEKLDVLRLFEYAGIHLSHRSQQIVNSGSEAHTWFLHPGYDRKFGHVTSWDRLLKSHLKYEDVEPLIREMDGIGEADEEEEFDDVAFAHLFCGLVPTEGGGA